MEKVISKKKFQQMLNAADIELRGNLHGAIVNGHRHNKYHQAKRLYGDYLRAQDPWMFDANYTDYLSGAHQHLNKYL